MASAVAPAAVALAVVVMAVSAAAAVTAALVVAVRAVVDFVVAERFPGVLPLLLKAVLLE